MLRVMLLIIALTIPTQMFAQETALQMKLHERFVQSLIDHKSNLHLTSSQIARLKAYKVRLESHRPNSVAAGNSLSAVTHDVSITQQMHRDLIAMLHTTQRKKFEVLWQKHVEECGLAAAAQCTVK